MMTPVEIKLHQQSRILEIAFEDDSRYHLSCEYLRVNSPSAEVQGHHPSQRVLVAGKRRVNISAIDPVGHYAVRLKFEDGHETGLYTWEKLHELGENQAANWQNYLDEIDAAGKSRDG